MSDERVLYELTIYSKDGKTYKKICNTNKNYMFDLKRDYEELGFKCEMMMYD